MTIGERIQKLRKERGLSQKQLGELLGVSGSMIGQYENDLRKPKYETLEKIASALGSSFEEIIDTPSEENSPKEFSIPIDSGMVKSLDYFARKSGRSIKDEVDIAIDSYLDVLVNSEIDEDGDDGYAPIRKLLINEIFDGMNPRGQQKALEMLEAFAQVPVYKKGNQDSE